MAELATIAGITITVPGLLSGAWTVLKAAYDLYGSVDRRREQIRVLLDRCGDLIKQIAEHLEADASGSPGLTVKQARSVEAACQSVKDIMEIMNKKGFMWCMIHQDKIDNQIGAAQGKITDVFNMFYMVAHLDGARFHLDLAAAREQDQADLSKKLEQLSENDQRILTAIQDQNGVHRRMEDLLVAIYKRVQDRPHGATPEDAFLRSAANALHRVSNRNTNTVPEDWVLSSLEVDFDQKDLIGQGSFGRIFRGEWNGALVAIKQMYVEDARGLAEGDRKVMRKEIVIWSRLKHPNVLNLYGACMDATVPFLVMRHCKFGNVCGYIKTYPDANRVDLSHDVVAGLSYLHSKSIVHADLKGVNVLVGDDHHAVLTDFGLSITLDDIRSRSTQSTKRGVTQGTLRWMAPECLDGEPSSKAADVYALGITIWEIYSGEIPFQRTPDRALYPTIVHKQKRPDRPGLLTPDGIWDLIQKCWVNDPEDRPTASGVEMSLRRFTSLYLQNDYNDLSSPEKPSTYFMNSNSDKTTGATPVLFPPTVPPPNAVGNVSSRANSSISSSQWQSMVQTHRPAWTRGNPRNYVNSVTFPQVLKDKAYTYRVVKDGADLGIRPSYKVQEDGSQSVNLLEYNRGYGVSDTIPVEIFAVDPEDHGETLVAQWSPRQVHPH